MMIYLAKRESAKATPVRVWGFTGDIQKIKEQDNSWRRRVGDYRIFYDIKKREKVIEVTRVERRTSKTY